MQSAAGKLSLTKQREKKEWLICKTSVEACYYFVHIFMQMRNRNWSKSARERKKKRKEDLWPDEKSPSKNVRVSNAPLRRETRKNHLSCGPFLFGCKIVPHFYERSFGRNAQIWENFALGKLDMILCSLMIFSVHFKFNQFKKKSCKKNIHHHVLHSKCLFWQIFFFSLSKRSVIENDNK